MNGENAPEVVEKVLEGMDQSLIDLFEEMTFAEKWQRVMEGLKMSPETGEYKFAKLQVKRLWAPASAFASIFVLILILLVAGKAAPAEQATYKVTMVEPDKLEKPLEEIPPEPPPVDQPPPDISDMPPIAGQALTPGTANMPGPPGPSVPFSPKPAAFDTVAMIKSPVVLRGLYSGRTTGMRGSLLGRGGGGSWTEDAVLNALRWLKKNQNEDGSWPQTKPAMTAFALLTYLAHGETPASEEFGYTVEKAIRFLIESQDGNGHFKGRDGHDYTHPIAAYALCEAYGMTKVPQIKYAAQKAIAEILKGQHASGGFNYNLNPEDRDDTSYMAWCAQALKAADIAYVMDEPDAVKAAMRKAVKGFQKNFSAGGGGDSGYAAGGFGYTGPAVSGLTGAGTLCMQLLGAAKEKEVRGAIQTMEGWTFSYGTKDLGSTIYYAYYSTQAKFHEGGEVWKKWNAQCAPSLVKGQVVVSKAIEDAKGKLVDIGYWDTDATGHADGGEGHKVMTTCLCTLMLEVYYRYLPTFQTPQGIDVAAPAAEKKDAVKIDVNI
jgi:hypothetical protein